MLLFNQKYHKGIFDILENSWVLQAIPSNFLIGLVSRLAVNPKQKSPVTKPIRVSGILEMQRSFTLQSVSCSIQWNTS